MSIPSVAAGARHVEPSALHGIVGTRGEGRSATHRAMELMAEKRFDATRIHTHTFPLADLPTALRYARERVEDAIKVVVTNRQASAIASAAE